MPSDDTKKFSDQVFLVAALDIRNGSVKFTRHQSEHTNHNSLAELGVSVKANFNTATSGKRYTCTK